LEDDELMPERGILGFEPALRLEGRSQQLQSQEDQRDHSRQPDAILSLVQYGWGFRYTQGASAWRYDAAAHHVLLSANFHHSAILHSIG
jgi:hypothetical protein